MENPRIIPKTHCISDSGHEKRQCFIKRNSLQNMTLVLVGRGG